jgi:mRNA interferase RelE/StbE
VTREPAERYEIRFQPAARRAISERLPESVAAAVLEFCDAALAVNPHRVGKPLFGPLAGCHGARRGTYRIVYRIEENTRTVHILDIDHRADAREPRRAGPAAGTSRVCRRARTPMPVGALHDGARSPRG